MSLFNMWVVKASGPSGKAPVIQPLTLAFSGAGAVNRWERIGGFPGSVVRVEVEIREIDK